MSKPVVACVIPVGWFLSVRLSANGTNKTSGTRNWARVVQAGVSPRASKALRGIQKSPLSAAHTNTTANGTKGEDGFTNDPTPRAELPGQRPGERGAQ